MNSADVNSDATLDMRLPPSDGGAVGSADMDEVGVGGCPEEGERGR